MSLAGLTKLNYVLSRPKPKPPAQLSFSVPEVKNLLVLFFIGERGHEQPLDRLRQQRKTTTSILDATLIPTTGIPMWARVTHDEVGHTLFGLSQLVVQAHGLSILGWRDHTLRVWCKNRFPIDFDLPIPDTQDEARAVVEFYKRLRIYL